MSATPLMKPAIGFPLKSLAPTVESIGPMPNDGMKWIKKPRVNPKDTLCAFSFILNNFIRRNFSLRKFLLIIIHQPQISIQFDESF